MLKNCFLITLLSLCFLNANSQSVTKPKLVVGVVVDQMRAEFLYRFNDHYGQEGFNRLKNEGYNFKNAHFNYIPTYTGPGHASVYTGTTPRVHGIIANDWYDKANEGWRYCVQDNDHEGVGGKGKVGQRSPKNLQASTITDELKLFYQGRSKVVSVSIKDRGAILPGGHQPDGAYWYDGESGNFITSTFYGSELPAWVSDFNKKNSTKRYLKEGWKTLKDISTYTESARDDRSYEASLDEDKKPVFPYDLKAHLKEDGGQSIISSTPFGNTMLLDIALSALENEDLGQDDIPDFLAISFSSTDYVGHAFGPYSKEIQDTYIRLDLELARLMNTLDEKVGKGEWTLMLTADHAVSEIPFYLQEKGFEVNYLSDSANSVNLKVSLKEKFGVDNLIKNISNHQVFLDKALIEKSRLDLSVIKGHIIETMSVYDGIAAVYDSRALSAYGGDDLDVKVLSAGLNNSMSGDIVFTNKAGWLGEYNLMGGTTHGSGYSYDTHVPMLFYGNGIKKGSTHQYHPITDIAPTLSMLLEIKLPSGATGQPAVEVLD